jgi:hypothetical protein
VPIVPTSAESPQEVGFTWTKDSVSKMQADKNLTGSRGLTVRFSGEAAGPGLLPSPGKVGASPILKSDASSTRVSGNVLCFEEPFELDPEEEKTNKDSVSKMRADKSLTGSRALTVKFSREAAGPGLLPSPGKVGASPILKSDASSTLVSGNVLCFEGPIELDPEDEKTYKDSDNKKCSFCGWFTGTDSLCFSFSHRLLQETQVSTRKSLHIKGTLLRI